MSVPAGPNLSDVPRLLGLTIAYVTGLILVCGCGNRPSPSGDIAGESLRLVQKWESDTTLTTAESVIFDEDVGLIYVSCIGQVPPDARDGDGFIAQVSFRGKVLKQRWISGLHAPKGMAIVDDTLYVTDITEIVKIQRKTGQILDRVGIQGAIFLNDIAVDQFGALYISDTRANRIYKMAEDSVEVWLDDPEMGGPNGLCVTPSQLMVATFGSGKFYGVDLKSKAIGSTPVDIPSGDGVVKISSGYLVSNWNGAVYHVDDDGQSKQILDTKSDQVNAADIGGIALKSMLLVPTFFRNSVVAYEIQ